MPVFNENDPAKQEAVRRKSHEYKPLEGMHGKYVERPYMHQEYPKVMDKTPAPKLKDFKGKPDAEVLLANAQREWEELQKSSTVQNKAEEEKYVAEHQNEKVTSIADRQYPKTMDKTPQPVPNDFDGLEDFRAARKEWNERIAASIVHDREEEELWLREHAPETAKARGKKSA